MSRYEDIMERRLLGVQSGYYAVTDADVHAIVRYVGSEDSAQVTVASGDLTFQHGDLASEAVDDTIDSGGDDPGVIDVSDANANSMGEVIDLINASANWEARIMGCLRADASAGWLLDRSETDITSATSFLPLFGDTSANFSVAVCIGPQALEVLKGATVGTWVTDALIARYRSDVSLITHNSTFASGVATINIYDRIGTVETLIHSYAGAATTVEATKDFLDHAIESLAVGHELMIRVIGSAQSAGFMSVIGRTWQFQ